MENVDARGIAQTALLFMVCGGDDIGPAAVELYRVSSLTWQVDSCRFLGQFWAKGRLSFRFNFNLKGSEKVMATVKGASLDPSNFSKGGRVPDGKYRIKAVTADWFDYNGTQEPQPAMLVLYAEPDNPKVTYEQAYTAGKPDRLVPSDDKKRFVHPKGEAAIIASGSNTALFITAIMKAGFPAERLAGDDVTVFADSVVELTNAAQPARAGLTGSKDSTIPLPTRVVALPGEKAGKASAKAPAAATSGTNGDGIDEAAVQAVIQVLKAAKDNTVLVKGLGIKCLKYADGVKLAELSKLMTPEWLEAHAEEAGWATDGEQIVLG